MCPSEIRGRLLQQRRLDAGYLSPGYPSPPKRIGWELEKMCNLAAEIFRIEKSTSLKASIPPFVSFLKWTTKAGAQQDSLKRAVRVWFTRAQRGVKLFDDDEAIEALDLEETEMGLAERIEKWTDEIKAEGREQGIFEERKRVARKLLAAGTPVAQIQEITGLSADDIALLM